MGRGFDIESELEKMMLKADWDVIRIEPAYLNEIVFMKYKENGKDIDMRAEISPEDEKDADKVMRYALERIKPDKRYGHMANYDSDGRAITVVYIKKDYIRGTEMICDNGTIRFSKNRNLSRLMRTKLMKMNEGYSFYACDFDYLLRTCRYYGIKVSMTPDYLKDTYDFYKRIDDGGKQIRGFLEFAKYAMKMDDAQINLILEAI